MPPISAGSNEGRLSDGNPSTRAEFFDFRHRTRGEIPIADIPQQIEAGQFVWIDVDCTAGIPPSLGDVLPWRSVDGLDPCEVAARCAADKGHGVSSPNRAGDLLHIVLVGGAIRPDEIVDERLDVLLGTSFLLTMHRGPNAVIQGVRSVYVRDFETHAATPSFLVYEIWSNQIEQFFELQRRLDEEAEVVRARVRQAVDAATLDNLAQVNGRLLALRKLVVPARKVLEEMLLRKTPLISDATLTFMGHMVGMLERLLADIASNLDVLSSSLAVSAHNTNQNMNRLTVMSTLFLPLTFLCGV